MAHRTLPLKPATPLLCLLAGLWLTVPLSASAQVPPQGSGSGSSSQTASTPLADAREAFTAALLSGQDAHPDQPAWTAAYLAAEAAVSTAHDARDDADLRAALLHSARVYSHIGWHSRAFAAYDSYMAEGGELDDSPFVAQGVEEALPSDLASFVASANQLAFARYQAGDMQGATGYYLSVLDVAGDDREALRWLGRIAFERGDQEGAGVAVNYFSRLVELEPDDQTAHYFLELSRERLAVGAEASDAFREAIALYENGDVEAALAGFQAALAAAPDYLEAEVWAGRTALESGRPDVALGHWQRVVAARPDDQGAAWFRGYAQAQVTWGEDAGRAYYDGLASYEAGDLGSAVDSFTMAVEANPEFVDAWVWGARSLQEAGRPLDSIPYWQRVIELDSDDERARWYLARARTAREHGEVAGPAYYDALANYRAGAAETALEFLETALEATPDFTEAWALRGRIAFQQQRYELAAASYERASELEPGNEDYAFFATEARLLSADEEGSGE